MNICVLTRFLQPEVSHPSLTICDPLILVGKRELLFTLSLFLQQIIVFLRPLCSSCPLPGPSNLQGLGPGLSPLSGWGSPMSM